MDVTKEPEDERDKEIYCADVERKFLNPKERETKTLLKNEEYVYEFEFNTKDKKAGYGKQLAEEERMIRIYGRTRIKCLDNKTIQARVVVLQKEILNENRGKLWEYSSSKIQEDRSQNTDSGQFSGVVGYTELNITVNDMKKGECLVLGDYAQGGDPREANGRNTGFGNPDNKEYPIPLYADTREKYKYFFGNFGIIYNITFKGQESNKLRMYPFGHNYATAAAILIKEGNKGWDVKYLYSPNNDMTETKNLYSKFPKDDGVDKMALIGYTNAQIFPKASEEINIINNKLSYMLSGGNCGCIKFLME